MINEETVALNLNPNQDLHRKETSLFRNRYIFLFNL